MAEEDLYVVTEPSDAVAIDTLIDTMKKKIDFDCLILLQQARRLNSLKNNFSIKLWENKINDIRQAQRSTFSIEELNRLKEECTSLSLQLSRFKT